MKSSVKFIIDIIALVIVLTSALILIDPKQYVIHAHATSVALVTFLIWFVLTIYDEMKDRGM